MQKEKIVISEKLKSLKIEIPNAPDPVGAYVAFKKVNNLLYISGIPHKKVPSNEIINKVIELLEDKVKETNN